MHLTTEDRIIVNWALKRGRSCTLRCELDTEQMGLVVHLPDAEVFFEEGRLVTVACRDSVRCLSELTHELALLFALCGYLAFCRDADAETPTRMATPHPQGTSA